MDEQPVLATVGLVFLGIFVDVGQLIVVGLTQHPVFGLIVLVANVALPFFLYRRPGWNALGAGILIGWGLLALLSGACFSLVLQNIVGFVIGSAIGAALGWAAARMLVGPTRQSPLPRVLLFRSYTTLPRCLLHKSLQKPTNS